MLNEDVDASFVINSFILCRSETVLLIIARLEKYWEVKALLSSLSLSVGSLLSLVSHLNTHTFFELMKSLKRIHAELLNKHFF